MCAGAGRQAELAYKGFSLAGYRAAAADPRYRIVPPAYTVEPPTSSTPPAAGRGPGCEWLGERDRACPTLSHMSDLHHHLY